MARWASEVYHLQNVKNRRLWRWSHEVKSARQTERQTSYDVTIRGIYKKIQTNSSPTQKQTLRYRKQTLATKGERGGDGEG